MRYLIAGLAGLVAIWLVTPPLTPPLYDGLTGNVAPYRYLQPPPGTGKTPPPTSGKFTDAVAGGKSVEAYVTTRESPAQAIAALGDGALRVPSGVKIIIVTIRPVRPPSPVPGILDGNVYLVGAHTPRGQAVNLAPGAAARILLRKTGAEATAVVEQFVAGSWTRRPTSNFVNANYLSAPMASLGYYALVLPNGAAAPGPDYTLFAVGAVVVLLVVGALIALRLLRRPEAVAA